MLFQPCRQTHAVTTGGDRGHVAAPPGNGEGRKGMYLSKRDVIATGLVAVAGLLYLLWAIGSALPGMSSARAPGVAVLALGFAASASAGAW
jgi:hypothetical protein